MAESGGGTGSHQAPLLDDPAPMDVQSVQESQSTIVTAYGLGSLSVAQTTEVVLDPEQEVIRELLGWHAQVRYNVADRGPRFLSFLDDRNIDEPLAYRVMLATRDEPVSHVQGISRHARPAMVSPFTAFPALTAHGIEHKGRQLEEEPAYPLRVVAGRCWETRHPGGDAGVLKREDIVPPLRFHALIVLLQRKSTCRMFPSDHAASAAVPPHPSRARRGAERWRQGAGPPVTGAFHFRHDGRLLQVVVEDFLVYSQTRVEPNSIRFPLSLCAGWWYGECDGHAPHLHHQPECPRPGSITPSVCARYPRLMYITHTAGVPPGSG